MASGLTRAAIGYVATMLLAISVALATFLFVRQFDGVGYNIVWGRDAAFASLLHFGLLAVILIPLGTALHFIRFDPAVAHWKSLPVDAFGIFLLTAWPEELLFRGLLQNSLSRTFSSETGGWITASVMFGLAHITNNGVFPNWRYALLATIAGIFYGRTWRKTGSIFPSAIVHALVDTTLAPAVSHALARQSDKNGRYLHRGIEPAPVSGRLFGKYCHQTFIGSYAGGMETDQG